MKLKHVLSTMGIAAILGLGVAGGLVAAKGAVETKAATEETTFYIDIRNTLWTENGATVSNVCVYLTTGGEDKNYIWHGGASDSGDGMSTITVNGVSYATFSITGRTSYTYLAVYCWDTTSVGNQTAEFTFASFSSGQNLVTISGGGTWSANQSYTLGTLSVGTTYTVTKYGVYDGTKGTDSIGSDTVSAGDSYAIPGRINSTGYHFGGWYTDEACTVAYTATEINADLDLYAKYTTLVADSYFYYVSSSDSTGSMYLYTYGGDVQFGAWAGTQVTAVSGQAEVHGVLSLNGSSQYIYKIPYSTTAADTHVIIHDNGGNQTANLALAEHGAYTYAKDAGAADADLGAAIDLLLASETKRNAVTASGSILVYSICGVSADDAATLYNAYAALSDGAKAYVDATTTYTYDPDDSSKETNVSYAAIMQQLYAIAVAGGTISGALVTTSVSSNVVPMVALVVILSISVVAMVGFVYFSKKKKAAK